MSVTVLWFRRDLRVDDQRALLSALRCAKPIVAVFVFDQTIIAELPANDRRLSFIHQSLQQLQQSLADLSIPLYALAGNPQTEIPAFAARVNADKVICSEDYEPQAIARDANIAAHLREQGRCLLTVCDQVIFAKDTICKADGSPYTVFTPYKKAWLARYLSGKADIAPEPLPADCPSVQQLLPSALAQAPPLPALADLGFIRQDLLCRGGEHQAGQWLDDFLPRLPYYHARRDFPGRKGVSYLAPYLRFGLLSIRKLAAIAVAAHSEGGDMWLNELIWREFYQQFLYHHPHVVKESFRVQYRHLAWENPAEKIAAWQAGQTGYPLVDAAMRQLRQTGYMHNRLRMISASFFVKDLLADWRIGEAYFARELLDFDLAANNGGWQWSASTGCDAQPYFRIFNPVTQSQKFDPEGRFIRRYVPELAHLDNKSIHAPWQSKAGQRAAYPAPIVDHAVQRKRALALFKQEG